MNVYVYKVDGKLYLCKDRSERLDINENQLYAHMNGYGEIDAHTIGTFTVFHYDNEVAYHTFTGNSKVDNFYFTEGTFVPVEVNIKK